MTEEFFLKLNPVVQVTIVVAIAAVLITFIVQIWKTLRGG